MASALQNKEKRASKGMRTIRSIGSIAKNALTRSKKKKEVLDKLEEERQSGSLLSQVAGSISNLFACLPIFLPNNSFKSFWNTLIITVTFIISISIPLQIGFGEEPSLTLQIFDVLLDLIYMGDVVVLFRSAIILDNKYIKDPKAIAMSYIRSSFFSVDMIAALPADVLLIASGDDRPHKMTVVLTVFRLLKVLKIIKCIFVLGDSFRKTVNVRPSDYVRMSALVFYLLLVTHWIACIYAGMCREADFPREFCKPSIEETDEDPLRPLLFNQDDLAQWYTYSFLWGITSLTGIEIVSQPIMVRENVFCIGVVLFGVFVYAAIIGNVNGIMSNQRFAETEFQRRVDSVVQYMNYRKVPESHKKKVMMYYRILWARNRGVNEELLLADLSRSLRSDTLRYVNTGVVSKLTFLEDADEDHINLFCERFISVFQLPGDIVATHNTTIDYIYFITRGVVESISHTPGQSKELKKGDSIGLEDMILGDKYTKTSRTKTFCDLVQIPKEHMLELIYILPQLRVKVEIVLRKKKLEEQRQIRQTRFGATAAADKDAEQSGSRNRSGGGEAVHDFSDSKLIDDFKKSKEAEAFANKSNQFGFRETLFATVQEADIEDGEAKPSASTTKAERRRSSARELEGKGAGKRHSFFQGMGFGKKSSVSAIRLTKKPSNLGDTKSSAADGDAGESDRSSSLGGIRVQGRGAEAGDSSDSVLSIDGSSSGTDTTTGGGDGATSLSNESDVRNTNNDLTVVDAQDDDLTPPPLNSARPNIGRVRDADDTGSVHPSIPSLPGTTGQGSPSSK